MEMTQKGILTVGAIAVVGVAAAAVGVVARGEPEPAAATLAQTPAVTVYKTPT
jgi:hypothetical protein